MAIPPKPTATILLVPCLFSLFTVSLSSDSIVSELSDLQSLSPTGVIHLYDDLLRRILSLPTPRSFHFHVFFDAQTLHSKPQLPLSTLKSEFSLVSSSFLSNNPNKTSTLFFFDVEFEESKATFSLFGVNSLPHIRLIPPSAVDPKTDSIKMDASGFRKIADSMVEFIESKTKLSVGPINRPPPISKQLIIITIAVVLISSPFLTNKLVPILQKKGIWMAGAIFVYTFSISGMMYNIIKKTPMFMADKHDPERMIYFYKARGAQLGMEGFAIGALYTIVGLLLAFVCHVVVRVRNVTLQRLLMIFAVLVSYWAVKKVVFLNNWKTGFRVRGYWPSTWR